MEEIIERFLLLYKYCPLPEVGTLELQESFASMVSGENKLSAPVPLIKFNENVRDTDTLLHFISLTNNVDIAEAQNLLTSFCYSIKNLEPDKVIRINRTCIFSNVEGKLNFTQVETPYEFLPPVNLKRVIHPNNVHKVRVGDDERTSVFMTEFLNQMKIGKDRFRWFYAASLAAIAISLILFYFIKNKNFNMFGNGSSIQVKTEVKKYEIIQ